MRRLPGSVWLRRATSKLTTASAMAKPFEPVHSVQTCSIRRDTPKAASAFTSPRKGSSLPETRSSPVALAGLIYREDRSKKSSTHSTSVCSRYPTTPSSSPVTDQSHPSVLNGRQTRFCSRPRARLARVPLPRFWPGLTIQLAIQKVEHSPDSFPKIRRQGHETRDQAAIRREVVEVPRIHHHRMLLQQLNHKLFVGTSNWNPQHGVPATLDLQSAARRLLF